MDNSPARGTRDLLPSAVATRDHVLATITDVYHRFGYQRIETPALEDINRLTGGQGGENEKLLFQVLRRGLPAVVEAGTPLHDLIDFGLRFDLTVPLTRFYGNNQATLPTPFRSFQFGPVWRAERPAKGRYRQFYQCDIDLIGEASVLAEVELIEATAQALAGVGLTGTTVRLSDRRYLSALAAAVGLDESAWSTFFIGLDKLDKIGWDGVRAELVGRDLPGEAVDAARERIESLTGLAADKVADTLSDVIPALAEDVVADLGTVAGCLDELSGLTWEFDPTLVRGMGYYTGQIFEVGHPSVSYSLAGGGRYDKLIGRSLGKDVPACGFSIGFERIVDMLGELPREDSVAVLFESDVPLATVFRVAREVRSGGRTAAVQPRSGKFGAQLGRLEAAGFTSLIHLKADTAEPEERPLGK
ncbi:histidine--tRNA ligase [Kutzneria sp. CA-103260]|uniref:histidine--tRNA ligase n=1 Tax=Kutzneria sp. CA-103260 TaxID=2802641 RepID=UPI001BED3D6A|nr:histidine--tRNA ligase [Kutzneria sp. CA-103260]QUQ66868.1 histidyl-tRNA synthetase [Kutzneria sp. CA-103260]